MKNLIAIFTCFTLVFFSCSSDEHENTIEETTTLERFGKGKNTNSNFISKINKAQYVSNEVVIQYKVGKRHNDVNPFRIANGIYEEGMQSYPEDKQGTYRLCDLCSDDAIIELWSFDDLTLDIEIKAQAISSEDDSDSEGGVINSMSRNLSFVLENDDTPLFGTPEYTDYMDKIVSNNSGTTVAVIDSGLNPNFPIFDGQPFLFNKSADADLSALTEFDEVISGWDFVNSDNDPFDDNFYQHGSAVTGTLKAKLDKDNTSYQIIPLKISNEDGQSTLFNKICAVNAAGNMGAKVVNISSGYYRPNISISPEAQAISLYNNAILIDLFQQFNDVLFVTSAGNANNNNDTGSQHKPSSIPEDNILAIAAGKYPKNATSDVSLTSFSNHGINSVDFVAKGFNVPFTDVDNNTHLISGTSFSAPKVSAVATKIINGSSFLPVQTINKIRMYYATYLPVIEYDRQVQYHKYVHE